MTTNEETLQMLRSTIYLQTIYENTKNGKLVWSQIDSHAFHARQMEPAAARIPPGGSTPVTRPRCIWDFYLVRNIVSGNYRIILDVQRNGETLYSFNTDNVAVLGDI